MRCADIIITEKARAVEVFFSLVIVARTGRRDGPSVYSSTGCLKWKRAKMACSGKRRGWGVPLFLAVGQMHMGSHVTRGLTGGDASKMSVVCVCV